MMITEFANHRLFDRQGRRLAIFGKAEKGMLNIFVLKCSTGDKFSRKVAREVYQNYLSGNPISYKPIVYSLPLTNPKQPKNSFLRHCNDTYQKAYPVYEIVKYNYYNDVEAMVILKNSNND